MYSNGSGSAVIVIPGIQGRWEWLRPALDALTQKGHRTISYSLAGDFRSEWKVDASLGFENYVRQVDDIFRRTGLTRAAICGISYGGFIALRYAATRPERVSRLILTSSPSPGWKPNPRQSAYVASPWMSTPAFVATAPRRLGPEILAAFDDVRSRVAFCASYVRRVCTAPAIPSLMASRIVEQQSLDFADDCSAVRSPTLVITGEPHLDAVVPVDATRQYLALIRGAQYAQIPKTGHLGIITRPYVFASIVSEFIQPVERDLRVAGSRR
jgi:pimeloyl-ACP methyl ester carboxylesterase